MYLHKENPMENTEEKEDDNVFFGFGGSTFNQSHNPSKMDLELPELTITRTFYNYYGREVYVRDRQGLLHVVQSHIENTDPDKFLVRDTYLVSPNTYPRLRAFVEAAKAKLKKRPQRFQAFVHAACNAIQRHASATGLIEFHVDAWVNIDRSHDKPLYVADLDIMVYVNPAYNVHPHPMERDNILILQYGELIKANDYLGVTYEIVDTNHAINKRYINFNGVIFTPKIARTANKADGIYIYTHYREDGIITIAEKHYPLDADPLETGVFKTHEEAVAYGDVKGQRAIEMLRIEQELTDSKRIIEEMKNQTTVEQLKLQQEKIRLESELATLKAQIAKEQSTRDSANKEREYQLNREVTEKTHELTLLKNELDKERALRESELEKRKSEYNSLKHQYDELKIKRDNDINQRQFELDSAKAENERIKLQYEQELARIKRENEDAINRAQKEKIALEKELVEAKAKAEKEKLENDKIAAENKAKYEKEKLERERIAAEEKARLDKEKAEREAKLHQTKTETDIKQTERKEKISKKSDKRTTWLEVAKFTTAAVGVIGAGILVVNKVLPMIAGKAIGSAIMSSTVGSAVVGGAIAVGSAIKKGAKSICKSVKKGIKKLKFW